MEKQDGRRWWRRRGMEPQVTDGERLFMTGTEEQWHASQEMVDARRLIQTGDWLSVEIGKARLRALLGREKPEDF